jgi:hypothetical protein
LKEHGNSMNGNMLAKLKNGGDVPRNGWDEELAAAIQTPPASFQDPHYEPGRYAAAGLMLGALAGCTSLVANVVGSVLWPAISGESQHPLRLIQIYLTFPFGETALRLDGGLTMFLGCTLYLCTGMLYGMLFELVISSCLPRANLRQRLAICSALALSVWVINFYAILSWIQPLLFGGRWITDLVPWWVAAGTHLVFGWTMAAIYPLGHPKRFATEKT